jgi:two-component system chemotaxis response regulator CheB
MKAKARNPRRKKKIRVLIVDDSCLLREMLAGFCSLNPQLKVVGYAKDGLEALAAIRKLKPEVVTLDIQCSA